MKKNCLNCQTEFSSVKNGGKFCSHKCSTTYQRSKQSKPENNVNCHYCHKSFYKMKSKMKSSKSGLYFCSREHKDMCQRIMNNSSSFQPYNKSDISDYRTYAFYNYPKICMRCGFNHPAAIQVHHKDGDRLNNSLNNLEVICANCHAIEHNS